MKDVTRDNILKTIAVGDQGAANMKVRVELLLEIRGYILEKGLKQKAAATLLGINQPEVSALMNGHIIKFSIDALVNMLARIGRETKIATLPKPTREEDLIISKIVTYMREIKNRQSVISKCIDQYQKGSSLTGYHQIDIDLCFLQFRKCLEIIMFSSVIAHDSYGSELGNQLRDKEYNASKITKLLKQVNPKYYPNPVADSGHSSGIRKVDDISNGYLTEPEFCKLYDRVCGNILHAKREDPYKNQIADFFTEILKYHNKLILLLNHHWIHVSEKFAYAVLMKTDSNDDVQVVRMQVISVDGSSG